MSQRTVVITGASRGIGRTLAQHYISQGWRVIATARDATTLSALNAANTFSLDATSEASIAALAGQIGVEPVHLLINNAGIYVRGGLDELTQETLVQQFVTNSVGPLLVAKALLPNLKLAATSSSSPAVVATVSSQMGSIGANSSGGSYGYRASKSAVNSFSKTLALDLKKDNVSAIVMHPGYVITDMAPQGHITTEQSVAGMSKVIQNALADRELALTGKFFNYSGEELPW
ncbi:hypothetical protein BC830DRAFT_1152976 [Chytriomyces sp. MP71]|nr:hypothetical protein BC830DRAFT_1152976 [Chytriomyces sp. MP71]